MSKIDYEIKPWQDNNQQKLEINERIENSISKKHNRNENAAKECKPFLCQNKYADLK
jgi:hypothetical protein